jgi:hypothetical protein
LFDNFLGYDISDSVNEVITTYCSDGSHTTESFPLASGHCQAEYSNSGSNAQQAESDAGYWREWVAADCLQARSSVARRRTFASGSA